MFADFSFRFSNAILFFL